VTQRDGESRQLGQRSVVDAPAAANSAPRGVSELGLGGHYASQCSHKSCLPMSVSRASPWRCFGTTSRHLQHPTLQGRGGMPDEGCSGRAHPSRLSVVSDVRAEEEASAAVNPAPVTRLPGMCSSTWPSPAREAGIAWFEDIPGPPSLCGVTGVAVAPPGQACLPCDPLACSFPPREARTRLVDDVSSSVSASAVSSCDTSRRSSVRTPTKLDRRCRGSDISFSREAEGASA
jgi:hypothetical protein